MKYFLLDYSLDKTKLIRTISVYDSTDKNIRVFNSKLEENTITKFIEYYCSCDQLPNVISFWDNSESKLEFLENVIRKYLDGELKTTFKLVIQPEQTLIDYSTLYEDKFCLDNKHFSYYLNDIVEDFIILSKLTEEIKVKDDIEKFVAIDNVVSCVNRLVKLCEYCDAPLSNFVSTSKLVECLYRKNGGKFDYSVKESEDLLVGGYSFAQIGCYNNVLALDFRSFYPSIIKTFNISNETIDCSGIKTQNNLYFSNEKIGIIPKIVTKLLEARLNCNEEDELNYKILVNAFYGCFAYKNSPIYSKDLASAITTTAQDIIKAVIQFINKYIEKKYDLANSVVFAFTDSLFIHKNGKDINDNEIIEMINKFVSFYVKKKFNCDTCYIIIDKKYTAKTCFILDKLNHIDIDENDQFVIAGTDIRRAEYSLIQRNYMMEFVKHYVDSNYNFEETKKYIEDSFVKFSKNKSCNTFSVRRKLTTNNKVMKDGVDLHNKLITYFSDSKLYDIIDENDEKLKFTFVKNSKNCLCYKDILFEHFKMYLDIDKMKCWDEFVVKPTMSVITKIRDLHVTE